MFNGNTAYYAFKSVLGKEASAKRLLYFIES